MTKKVERNYLEIASVEDLKEAGKLELKCSVNLVKPDDFQINKFFYKNVGKKHRWVDRLIWSEKQWIDYSSDIKVKTYILKVDQELAGYYELIFHKEKKETDLLLKIEGEK